MTKPSGCISILPPSFVSSFAVVSMRLVSLTRNSAASRIVVAPSAWVAASASNGSSSISLGIVAPPISVPSRADDLTKMSATGSPPISRWFASVMSAPISCRTSRIPVRVGLTPMSWRTISEWGIRQAATMKKAAEEMSPGTRAFTAARSWPGVNEITPFPSLVMAAPRALSMRSVWSRAGPGSLIVVGLEACNPAKRMADLTWALATGRV